MFKNIATFMHGGVGYTLTSELMNTTNMTFRLN